MKIYTRTGDNGSTQRPGGQRARKADPLIAAVGEIDELNSHVGLCLQACGQQRQIAEALKAVQPDLLAAGAIVASGEAEGKGPPDDAAVKRMERHIDAMTDKLPELKNFIIPGGCELACRLHVARAVCRRAERAVVAAADAGAQVPPVVLRYLNRLSDLLFVLARAANAAAGTEDAIWES